MMVVAGWRLGALACLLAALIDACASGDDRGGGIEGTGMSDGTASGFGSVFVNGVEFATDGAEIAIDGEPATENALRVGMVLRVSGTFERDRLHGAASRVEFDRRLFGPVEEVAPEENRIVALGQTVRVDESTVFVGTSLEAIEAQDLIVVSGFVGASGETLATLVEHPAEPYAPGISTVDAEGVVRDLTLTTCRIGDLTVDYTLALLAVEGGPLRNGAFVEVIGNQPLPRGILYASRIVVEDPAVAPPGERAELSGLIAGFSGLGDFSVGGQRVDASGAARTDNATVVPANDVRIEVEGVIDEHGRLVADSFALRPPSDVRLAGRIDSVDRTRERFVISGAPVAAVPTTHYEDQSSVRLRSFRVDDLRPGDMAEVRGFRDADGNVVATRIIRLAAFAP